MEDKKVSFENWENLLALILIIIFLSSSVDLKEEDLLIVAIIIALMTLVSIFFQFIVKRTIEDKKNDFFKRQWSLNSVEFLRYEKPTSEMFLKLKKGKLEKVDFDLLKLNLGNLQTLMGEMLDLKTELEMERFLSKCMKFSFIALLFILLDLFTNHVILFLGNLTFNRIGIIFMILAMMHTYKLVNSWLVLQKHTKNILE